jgi:Protein of unknown function (DUF2948)
MSELKLIALDEEDLNVLSAHLQDAILKVSDIAYLPAEKRFVVLANRFDWPDALVERGSAPSNSDQGSYTRHRCALRFEQVAAARLRGIDLDKKDQVLSMLALQFEPTPDAAPAGTITLVFAGDAAIRLDVAYVEAELRDLGGAWAARSKPTHPEDGKDTAAE